MPNRGPRYPGCKYIYTTDDSDVAILEIKSILGFFSEESPKQFVINRKDTKQIAKIKTQLMMGPQLPSAVRASDELMWWCGARDYGIIPSHTDRYTPARSQ
ncbi:MAG: hypothetical protein LAT64_07925 [Phycisphaerales bacterium]|nr:hypothetical protein [Planctomycetota bacterium]MCH8508682.1 hypothetical protein [Phycisphaerales bacterium]